MFRDRYIFLLTFHMMGRVACLFLFRTNIVIFETKNNMCNDMVL